MSAAAYASPQRLRLIDPLPIGEATELPGAVVRVLPNKHGWDLYDLAQMESDFAPAQPLGLDDEATAVMDLDPMQRGEG